MTAGSSRSTATTIASVLFGVAMLAASAAPAAASATQGAGGGKIVFAYGAQTVSASDEGPAELIVLIHKTTVR